MPIMFYIMLIFVI